MSLIATAAVINPEALKSSRRVLQFRNHLVRGLSSGDQISAPGPKTGSDSKRVSLQLTSNYHPKGVC